MTRFNTRALAASLVLVAAGFASRPAPELERAAPAPAQVQPELARGSATADTPIGLPVLTPIRAPEPLPTPAPAVLEVQTGSASYYASSLAGRRTASGERYDPRQLVAAHRHFPFGTILRVTNLANDRSVEVRVIDRGPFTRGRVLDLSRSAAEQIDMIRRGHVNVRIEVLSYGN